VIAGVDETGRGPLAGPVVAGCVILEKYIPGVTDSKLLSSKKRKELYNAIISNASCYSIGIVDNTIIDEINIHNASLLAMKNAVCSFSFTPSLVLVDGPYEIPGLNLPQKALIKGDRKNYLIGAASIIAKVVRDRIMEEYSATFPLYSFSKHKGYPTKAHIEEIKKYGLSPIHRRSFIIKL